MFAVLIGVAAGALQLYLLSRLTAPLLRGEPALYMVPIVLGKLALYAAVLFGTALLRPDRLVHMGVGLAVGLIAAAVFQYGRQRAAEKRAKGNAAGSAACREVPEETPVKGDDTQK